AYFAQIKSNELPSAFHYFPEEIIDLLCFKTSGNRRACMRTQLPVKPVDIKTYIHFTGQMVDYFFHDLFPCLSFKLPVLDRFIKISNDSAITVFNIVIFILTEIPRSNLYQF